MNDACLPSISALKHLFFSFQSGGSSALLMDLASNEKHVHADFYNDFDDLFDDGDDDILNLTSDNNS